MKHIKLFKFHLQPLLTHTSGSMHEEKVQNVHSKVAAHYRPQNYKVMNIFVKDVYSNVINSSSANNPTSWIREFGTISCLMIVLNPWARIGESHPVRHSKCAFVQTKYSQLTTFKMSQVSWWSRDEHPLRCARVDFIVHIILVNPWFLSRMGWLTPLRALG